MPAHDTQLAARKGLRGSILLELKRAQPLTAKDLAEKLSVSPNAIRHHLKELEVEGLVTYGRVQRGVGAPTFAYRLSDAGEALFPRRYEETLTELLGRLERKGGRDAAVGFFEEHYAELAQRLQTELDGTRPDARLDAVARLMTDAGYMAEWRTDGFGFRLLERNCAIRAVAEQFPEVCAAEEKFLVSVLGANVRREAHIASGCNACEYSIAFPVATKPGGDEV